MFIRDKEFELYLSEEIIQQKINSVAGLLNQQLKGKDPLFLVLLNGAFMYAADLFKRIDIPAEISFVKVSSYHGTSSTGKISDLIGLDRSVNGRTVVLVDDIADTGLTLMHVREMILQDNPVDVLTTTLLVKHNKLQNRIKIDFECFSIPDDFVVGYGLDYDGYGRNLKDIYKLKISG